MLSIVIICRWNFENMFISSRVIQENVFFGGHFIFSRANRKYILWTKMFHMCMQSIVIICRWNFENMFISSRVIQENVVLAAIYWIFPSKPEVDFENQIFFTYACYLKWSYAVGILKICSLVPELFKKTLFWRPFWIFLSEPEVDFENQNFSHVHAIYSDHMPLEFWKSVH